jgi:hypothetical protein
MRWAQRCWNARSPTASASSTKSTSGSIAVAIAKDRRATIPLE